MAVGSIFRLGNSIFSNGLDVLGRGKAIRAMVFINHHSGVLAAPNNKKSSPPAGNLAGPMPHIAFLHYHFQLAANIICVTNRLET